MSATQTDDMELLSRYATKRAEDAFSELVHRHVDLIHSAALRQVGGDATRAADVTQAVFTELARQAPKLTRHPALTGWLYTTTRRMAAHAVRGETRRQRREQEAHAMQELLRENVESELDWDRVGPVLDAAMHDLGETDRLAVLLRHFEQRPLAEVGARLGISENAARMRVDRALDKLRACLTKRGVISTSAALALALAGQAVTAAPASLAPTFVTTALAAVATNSTVGLFTLMASTKLKIAAATATVAISAAVPLAFQNQSLGQLRHENTGLRQQLTDVNRALRSASTASNLNSAELARLRAGQVELLHLRGEVGRLRQEIREMAQSKPPSSAPGTAATSESATESSVAFRTDLGDVGAATPVMAVSTFIWAATAGQHARVSELLELPQSIEASDAPRHYQFLSQLMSNSFSGKQFTSLEGVKPNPDGTLRLNFAYRDSNTGKTNPFPFMLRLHDSGWKVVVEGEPPKGF